MIKHTELSYVIENVTLVIEIITVKWKFEMCGMVQGSCTHSQCQGSGSSSSSISYHKYQPQITHMIVCSVVFFQLVAVSCIMRQSCQNREKLLYENYQTSMLLSCPPKIKFVTTWPRIESSLFLCSLFLFFSFLSVLFFSPSLVVIIACQISLFFNPSLQL